VPSSSRQPAHWIEGLGKRIFEPDIRDYTRKKLHDKGMRLAVEIGEGDAGPGNDWLPGLGTAEVGDGNRKCLEQISKNTDKVFAT
jgi:hypothetical protein